jgi:hypothetical protein
MLRQDVARRCCRNHNCRYRSLIMEDEVDWLTGPTHEWRSEMRFQTNTSEYQTAAAAANPPLVDGGQSQGCMQSRGPCSCTQ